MKFIVSSSLDLSLSFLVQLFHLVVNLRSFTIDRRSMSQSSTIDTKSLVQFDETLSETLIMIYNQSITKGYDKAHMQHIDEGPIDLVMNMTAPFHSRRWTLAIGEQSREEIHPVE